MWGELGEGLSSVAGHVWYIKLPMYLFFMELGLHDFEVGCILYRAIGRGTTSKFIFPLLTYTVHLEFRTEVCLNTFWDGSI